MLSINNKQTSQTKSKFSAAGGEPLSHGVSKGEKRRSRLWRFKFDDEQRHRTLISSLLVFVMFYSFSTPTTANPIHWAVYYANQAPFNTLKAYQLLVFDSKNHPPLAPLLERNTQVLSYLSLGEVGQHRHYFQAVKKQGLLLAENKNWPGSFSVDIRDPRWQARIIETLIPAILAQGFGGIFIDTLDNSIYLEQQQLRQYRGMTRSAIQLIQAIRYHYPDIKIMLNRAYAILPEVASSIDYVLGESVYTTYDFANKTYHLVNKTDYQQQVTWLKQAQQKSSKLIIATLDYWDPTDTQGIAAIYATQYANGFHPYVATIKLDQIVPKPIIPSSSHLTKPNPLTDSKPGSKP